MARLGALSEAYPPAPWHLEGRLLLSLFARAGGHPVVGVAFVEYGPGGDLAYGELLAATVSRALVPTVLQIWVDSAASRAGGRELWGMPKEMASFGGAAGIAGLRARVRPGGPRLPIPLPTLQRLDGSTFLAANLITARAAPMQARWEFDPAGPLAWLHGRRPFLSVALTDAGIDFGLVSRSWAPPTGRPLRRPPAARSAPAPRR